MTLLRILYEHKVLEALREDLGRAGDLTSNAIIPPQLKATAKIRAREAGCIAGLPVAALTFSLIDSELDVSCQVRDGDLVVPGQEILTVSGCASSILTAERTALNFLGHLSGIASATNSIVRAVSAYPTRIVCTRKTTPGLRALEKYAVRVGGGANHRFGLDDAVLIKDNHLAIAGGVEKAIQRVRRRVGHMTRIEVEVDTLDQLKETLDQPIDAVLLDNMSVDDVSEAVLIIGGRFSVEVSGGIGPETAVAYARAGADLISLGWLTHSTPALNLTLDIGVPAQVNS